MALWVERNQLFHDVGYCFGTDLGEQYFGNGSCTTRSPNLDAAATARVATIQTRESELRCAAERSQWSPTSIRSALSQSGEATAADVLASPSAQQTQLQISSLSRQQLRELQQSMQILGFYEGAIDGLSGPGTSGAVSQFLSSHGYQEGELTPEFILDLSAAESQGRTAATQQTQHSSNVAPSGDVDAVNVLPERSGPIALQGRTILPFDGSFTESDYMAVAVLQRMPAFERDELLRSLMSSQRLKDYVQYDRTAWQDPAKVQLVAAKIMEVGLPPLERISLQITANFQNLLAQVMRRDASQEGPVTGDVNLIGARLLAEFTTLATINGSNVKLISELAGLPNLNSVTLQPNDIQKYSADLATMPPFGRVYLHIDVTAFGADPSSNNLSLRGNVVGADYYGRGRGNVETYSYSFDIPLSDKRLEASPANYRAVIATLIDDMRKTQNVRVEPTFIDDVLDLRTVQASVDVFRIIYVSSALKLRPELLEEDEFAVSMAPTLLTLTERLRAFRGTALSQPGMLEGNGNWYQMLDPFERQDVAERMRSEMRDILISRAISRPVDGVVVGQMQLGEYNFEEEAFPVPALVGNRNIGGAAATSTLIRTMYRYDNNFINPEKLKMPAADARAFLKNFSDSRSLDVYFAIYATLPEYSEVKVNADYDNQTGLSERIQDLPMKVTRVVLFADEGLTAPIYEFEPSAFLLETQAVAGLTAYDVADIQIATTEAVYGAALTMDGNVPQDVIDIVAARTPSFTLIQEEKRPEYTESISDRYRALAGPDGVWVRSVLQSRNPDFAARTLELGITPWLGSLAREDDFETANIEFADYIEPENITVVPFYVDEALLQHSQSGFGNHRNDGLEATFETFNGQTLAHPGMGLQGIPYQAFVRIMPQITSFDGTEEHDRPFYLYANPVVLEYYVLFGDPSNPADFRILAHQNFEDGSVPSNTTEAVALMSLSPDDVIIVRKLEAPNDAPSGLVYSCVSEADIPDELSDLTPINLPVGNSEAVPVFINLIDAAGAWVTTTSCLQEGLTALNENTATMDQLVFRIANDENAQPVSELSTLLSQN